MSKAAIKKFRSEKADCLRKFGSELYSLGGIRDKKPFEDAYLQCLNGPIPDVKGIQVDKSCSWGYSLSNVIFTLQANRKIKNLKPDGVQLASIQMNALVIGNFISNQNHIEDPLAHLEFNLLIKGAMSKNESVICSWHLDRHLVSANSPEDVHPIYHLQYGGKNLKLEDGTFQYGSNFILDIPRFAHLPLDGVLGADFILSNFFGEFRNKCCSDSSAYCKYIAESQNSFWRPYILASSNHWSTFAPTGYDWPAVNILPQLI
jgi:hypothetical protein